MSLEIGDGRAGRYDSAGSFAVQALNATAYRRRWPGNSTEDFSSVSVSTQITSRDVEVPYTEEEADRDQQAVIDFFYRAGWIEKWCESDGHLLVQWTAKGKSSIERLSEFYDAAGAGDLNGRQIALCGLIAYVSAKIGIDHNNVSLIGSADLSIENGTNPKRDAA